MMMLSKILGVNLFFYLLSEPRYGLSPNKEKIKKASIYLIFQWFVMFFIFAFGYALSMVIQSILIQYIHVNNITIFLSALILIIIFVLTIITPFVFGYFFNNYVTNKLDI